MHHKRAIILHPGHVSRIYFNNTSGRFPASPGNFLNFFINGIKNISQYPLDYSIQIKIKTIDS